MKKRFLSIALCAAVLIGGCFTGCGNQGSSSNQGQTVGQVQNQGNTENNSKYAEFITVDVFDSLANYQGIQSGWFGKIVKEKFNMELNIIAPNVAGGGDTLFQTRSAAGNLGDLIIVGTENGRMANMVTAGLLMDMSSLLSEKDVLKNYKIAIDKANQLAGKEGIYGIPSEISVRSPQEPAGGLEPMVSPYVRWDAYKLAGYPQMNTLEDFLTVMKTMQENTPASDSGKQTYAISLFKDWDGNMMVGAKNIASLYGYNELGFVLIKADGSDIQDITSSDGQYVRALRFLFEANQAGLVDPESTTQNYDILSNKYRDGQVLTSLWSFQGPSVYNTAEHKTEGKGYMSVFIEDSAPYCDGCYSEGKAQTIIAIGSKAKDPQRLADFIDWLYSPEGMEISGQANGAGGPEGLTWEMSEGRAVLTDFGKQALPNNDVTVPEEWGGGSWKDGVSALNLKTLCLGDFDPNNNEPYLETMWASVLEENNTEFDLDWQNYFGGARSTVEMLTKKNALSVAAGTSYTQPEETSDITTLRNQCKVVIVDDSWRMVFAADQAEFDSILLHMQETVKGLGYEEVLAVDMQNAKDMTASQVQAVQDYNNR